MSRTFFSILALCALLSAAACTDITGPAVNDGGTRIADGGKHRNPGQIASPVVVDPSDGSGGSNDGKEPVANDPPGGGFDPGDLSPTDGRQGDGPRIPGELNP